MSTLTFGTEVERIEDNDRVVVTYECHCSLDDIPKTVKGIVADIMTVEDIKFDTGYGMWRIKYFEYKVK